MVRHTFSPPPRYNLPMSVELQYAPSRRRRIRWRWVFLALLIIAAVPLWHDRKELVTQAKIRWSMGQCRTYTRPPDSIALESNTVYAAQLAARDTSYSLLPTAWPLSPSMKYSWHNGEAFKSVDPWQALSVAMIAPGRQAVWLRSIGALVPTIPLFVHERTSKGRPARLVVVELGVDGLQGYVFAPGYPWQQPTLIWSGLTHNLGETIPDTLARVHNLTIQTPPGQAPPSLSLRQLYGPNVLHPPGHIYFGQPDPSDPAKFSIRVEIGKVTFTFVGQLMPDDTIQIEGPLLSEIFEKLGPQNGR